MATTTGARKTSTIILLYLMGDKLGFISASENIIISRETLGVKSPQGLGSIGEIPAVSGEFHGLKERHIKKMRSDESRPRVPENTEHSLLYII